MVLFILVGGSSCKKEQLLTSGGELRFSTDTLSFDTVFTTMGSATVGVKIFNPQSQKVTVSSIRMGQGAASPFRLNVDGKAGPGTNIEIAANDSAYVYATVKVDPNDLNSPFVVEDRLIATLNGNDFSIPVMAYGQNAHYIVNDTAISETTFQTDKPYVIIGYAVVAPGKTLNIQPGTRIYMHQNARLYVDGTLRALGTKKDSIIFQGDRLDRSYYGYEGYPGEWGGIYFGSYSDNNLLRHVVLRNCGRPTQGAQAAAIQVAPDSAAGTQLTMEQCTIENSIGYGVLAFNADIKGTNCLMHSCGANTIALVQGGKYQFDNCTFATYGNTKVSHTDNSVAIFLNYLDTNNRGDYIPGNLDARLTNCVIAGSLDEEFLANAKPGGSAAVTLNNCLVKATPDSVLKYNIPIVQNSVRYTRAGGTLDPMFVDVAKWNFRLKPESPLIDRGMTIVNPIDLDDAPRPRGAGFDIGAYESF
jgi:hypothetical protein